MMLPETQEPSRDAQRGEAQARHDCGPPGEVGPSLVLIEVVGNKAVPGRGGELCTGEVQGGAGDHEPGSGVRKQEWQQQDGNPGEGLANRAGQDQRLTVRKPPEQLDRCHLGNGADQLRQRREQAQLKRARMQQKGECGEVLFPAALGNRLAGTIPKAVPPAWLATLVLNRLGNTHTVTHEKMAGLTLSHTACVRYEIGVEWRWVARLA